MIKIDANNSWYYNPDQGQLCQIIESQTLWGETPYRVWLPGSDSVVRIPAANLKPLEDATNIAVACKIPENNLQEDPKLLMWYDQAVTRTGGEV